jgi:hypothetical protein
MSKKDVWPRRAQQLGACVGWLGCVLVSFLFCEKEHLTVFDPTRPAEVIWLAYLVLAVCVWLRGRLCRIAASLASLLIAALVVAEGCTGAVQGLTIAIRILKSRYGMNMADSVVTVVVLCAIKITLVGMCVMLALSLWNPEAAAGGKRWLAADAAILLIYVAAYMLFCRTGSIIVLQGAACELPLLLGAYCSFNVWGSSARRNYSILPDKKVKNESGGGVQLFPTQEHNTHRPAI